jgi:hypothetical protein
MLRTILSIYTYHYNSEITIHKTKIDMPKGMLNPHYDDASAFPRNISTILPPGGFDLVRCVWPSPDLIFSSTRQPPFAIDYRRTQSHRRHRGVITYFFLFKGCT